LFQLLIIIIIIQSLQLLNLLYLSFITITHYIFPIYISHLFYMAFNIYFIFNTYINSKWIFYSLFRCRILESISYIDLKCFVKNFKSL